jgi:hypothetical protein
MKMEIIEAENSNGLLKKLRALDASVPLRSGGRKTKHSEISSICHLLATIAETDLINYPMRVEHGDRPDIVIFFAGLAINVLECDLTMLV